MNIPFQVNESAVMVRGDKVSYVMVQYVQTYPHPFVVVRHFGTFISFVPAQSEFAQQIQCVDAQLSTVEQYRSRLAPKDPRVLVKETWNASRGG